MNTNQAMVDGGWLTERLGEPGLRLVEVDVSPTAYRAGHLPGAVLWNIYADLKDADYRLRDRAGIQALFERSGIDRDSLVVCYGYAPALGYWLLKLYGHPEARILVPGKPTLPLTTEESRPAPTRYPLPPEDERLRARSPVVEQAIGDPERIILDVRTEAEYLGERFWPSGAPEPSGRAGHIPSARHLPAERLFRPDGTLLPVDELRRVYEPLALDGREVITYCTIGARAASSWFTLTQLLGHPNARVYDGSWAEWGHLAQAAVA